MNTLNSLTGVNPDNFIKALAVFTSFAMVPVWMMTIAIMAAAMAIVSIMGLPVINIYRDGTLLIYGIGFEICRESDCFLVYL